MSKEESELLSLQTSAEGDEVFLHGSPAGLRYLARIVERIAAEAEGGEFSHDHFFSEEWGGGDLSASTQELGHHVVHHLKIYGWPDNHGT